MKNKNSLWVVVCFLFLSAFPVNAQIHIKKAFPNISFDSPVDFQHPGDGSNLLFVVEQPGRIYVFENENQTSSKTLFLDITDKVDDTGNEEGLLGLAFHPNYADNGYFYVDYTAASPARSVIARYSVSDTDPKSAVKESETVLLEVSQPYDNHNGGQIAFGPDNYLYISLGDGGSGGDPQGNGQDQSTLLGAILRIDVDASEGGLNYGIPDDNPFAGNTEGYREEIFAYGLRNPWRFSFDPDTGDLWTGDVGQNDYEEIDIIESGNNYGWNIMEGFHCYNASSCNTDGLTLPVWEYDHSTGRSITGGFVYRGPSMFELTGKYIYADYINGKIWSLENYESQNPENTLLVDSDLLISSFGTDDRNELYFTAFDGYIYQFESPVKVNTNDTEQHPSHSFLVQNYPNPFNNRTMIKYYLSSASNVNLTIYNSAGKIVSQPVLGFQDKGNQQITWNGKNMDGSRVAGGLYFYELKTAQTQHIKKMIYLP